MIISYKRLKETAWVLSPVSHTLHIDQCEGGGSGSGKMLKKTKKNKNEEGDEQTDAG